MLSLTSEYALRATVYLAQHVEESPITGRRIAEGARIPAKYLAKILGELVREGILESAPGKTGGFRLRRPPGKMRLYDILAPFEAFPQQRCPFGRGECDETRPCPAHERWKSVVDAHTRFFCELTLEDVAFCGQGPGKGRLANKVP